MAPLDSVHVCACMYDYHIAVSIKTLAPVENMCVHVCACAFRSLIMSPYNVCVYAFVGGV